MPYTLSEKLLALGLIVGLLALVVLFNGVDRSCLKQFEDLELAAVESTGKWQRTESADPMDDSTRVTLALEADSDTSTTGEPVVLYVRCKQRRLEVFIDWHEYLGGAGAGGDHYVLCRIGDAKAVNSRWSYSTNSEASFYEGHKGLSVCQFVLALAQADQLVVEVAPFMENPITAVFDTRGLRPHLASLLGECSP